MTKPMLIDSEMTRAAAANVVRGLALDGKAWTITISRLRKIRTLSQNALLHKWFDIIADHTGHTPDEVKDAYKKAFLPKRYIRLGKVEDEVPPSTAGLTTLEMTEFMDKIYADAAYEMGCILPIPEERYYDKDGHARVPEQSQA